MTTDNNKKKEASRNEADAAATNAIQNDDENIKQKYFGIKSYLHDFYEHPNETNHQHSRQDNLFDCPSTRWKIICLMCSSAMALGIMMMLTGFTMARMNVNVGYQEEMEIIDREAYQYNEHLDQMKIIGLVFFATGGIILAILLVSHLWSTSSSNRDNDTYHDQSAEPLKLNADDGDDDDDDDENSNNSKNLIPITEELKVIQPKQSTNAIVTTSGLKQIQ